MNATPQQFCENCGARLVAGIRFCEACGQPVAPAAPAIPSVAPGVIPPPSAPAGAPARGLSRRPVAALAGIVALLVIAIVAVVALRSARERPMAPANQPSAVEATTAAPASTEPITPQISAMPDVGPSAMPTSAALPQASATAMVAPLATPSPEPDASTAVPAIAASAAPPVTSGEIKVAILAPLSGPAPKMGVMTRDGALLAIAEWNAKGGVLGKKIVPVVEDSQCDENRAVSAANKVIDQDQVKFIIGEVCGWASLPVSEIANAKQVIQVSPASSNASLTVTADGKTKEYIFRACFTSPFEGKMAAKFAVNVLKAKTAFIMVNPASSYMKDHAESFEKHFTLAGGKVVGKLNYSSDDRDFDIPLARAAEARPDIIYLPDDAGFAISLVPKQAKASGITIPFIGSDTWDTSVLDVKAAAGSFFTTEYSPKNPRPEVQNFIKAFGDAYKGGAKTPDGLAALAYDATNLLLEGIKQADTDDTSQVKAALEKMQFNGLSGKTTFDAQHNPVKPVTILAVTDAGVQFKSVINP